MLQTHSHEHHKASPTFLQLCPESLVPRGSWVARLHMETPQPKHIIGKGIIYKRDKIYIISAARRAFQTHVLKKGNTLLSTGFSSAWDMAVQKECSQPTTWEGPDGKFNTFPGNTNSLWKCSTITAGWYEAVSKLLENPEDSTSSIGIC